MSRNRILILSESYGVGHTKAAEAIKEGILLLRPNWQVEVYELGSLLRPTINYWLNSIYMQTLRYSPKLWGVVYRKGQKRVFHPKISFILERFFYSRLSQIIKQMQPHLILCTHPFPSAAISRLKSAGLSIPLYTFITDYAAHGAWISSEVDLYYVPSLQVKEQMVQLRVPEHKIVTAGIPVHPKFWRKADKREMHKALQLSDLPTILCMGGGMGVGLSISMLRVIYQFREKMQILFVAGKNKRLYHSIQDNPFFSHPNFHLYGFVHHIDELMDASDILLTKPGGVTCAEAISKQLPMILFRPIPGQEEDNFQYMIEQQLAVPVTNVQEMEHLLTSFVTSPVMFSRFIRKGDLNYSGQTAINHLVQEDCPFPAHGR